MRLHFELIRLGMVLLIGHFACILRWYNPEESTIMQIPFKLSLKKPFQSAERETGENEIIWQQ